MSKRIAVAIAFAAIAFYVFIAHLVRPILAGLVAAWGGAL